MKKLGFGFMRLPLTDSGDQGSVDFEEVKRMVDYYLERGFNYFDTAYRYHSGKSETAVKEALAGRYPRASFILADKMPVFLVKDRADYKRIFEEQLEKCGVDYFDNYMLHCVNAPYYGNPLISVEGFGFLKKLKLEGKVRKTGFSYHDNAALLDTILAEHPEIDFVQLQINYADWDNGAVESGKCYEAAVKHGKPVIVMEPVKGGFLAELPEEAEKLMRACHPDKSAASWAIRFAASLDNACMVLSGMSSMDQLKDNAGSMENFVPLSAGEKDILGKVTAAINNNAAIPCTGCYYCTAGCPQGIPIPRFFSLFNDQRRFKFTPGHDVYYAGLTSGGGKASDCAGCGRCEELCPQHLNITSYLKDVAAVFEKVGA
ncbi:MAG: aldo/keto reductase [Treponema sp.]|jgi:predicted aldo/keto reductase-like oxidoreductase|nr:aldo/keto reductase [Treponema sp.]